MVATTRICVPPVAKGSRTPLHRPVRSRTIVRAASSDADGEAGVSYIEWILVDTLLGYEVGDMEKSFLLLFRSHPILPERTPSGNHKSTKKRIPNRKKTTDKSMFSCNSCYPKTAEALGKSTDTEFFTGN